MILGRGFLRMPEDKSDVKTKKTDTTASTDTTSSESNIAPVDVKVISSEGTAPAAPIAEIQAQQINVMTAPVTMVQPNFTAPPLPQGTSDSGKYEEFLLMPDAAWPPPIFLRKSVSAQERFYMANRWHSQWQYYDKKATEAKNTYFNVQRLVVIGSVIVPVIVSLGSSLATVLETMNIFGWQVPSGAGRPIIDVITVAVSTTVAVAAAIESLYKFGDDWNSYRSAAEELLAEKSFYDMQSGPYASNPNPFATFVDRTEGIIANQNGKYFQAQQQNLQKHAAQNEDLLERLRGEEEAAQNGSGG
jgi:hypothetical protein